ncbi:transient receptor potential cation channel subfamily V member 2-like [Pecten maximus]|uniref:transient receptor potential cation channel subfamily V member 2-like n=1 Tax=Pecten maximus TaxID=6579 RepID=UPI001458D737|nr:transient receptor potential cation channel subfamily V member 2-like [Pecten maximus]
MTKSGKKSKVGPTSSDFDGVMAIRTRSRGHQHDNSITDLLDDTLKHPQCDVSKYCGKRWAGYNQDTQSKFYKDDDDCSSCCLPNRNNRNNQDSKDNLIEDFKYEDGNSSDLHQLFLKSEQSETSNQSTEVDLQLADILLHSGTDINVPDSQGETVLHKAARKWHVDVALFLLNHGADVNSADVNGCIPLHVAAANNYTDMLTLLIEHGANKEARTKGDLQTPIFFAARYNCSEALNCLIDHGCQFDDIQDYKDRYPIQLAAEQDRSITTRLLLKKGARAWMNRNNVPGYGTIGWMIINMPAVAYEALDAYHTTDQTHRSQSFYLYQLMADEKKESFIDLPLQAAVNKHQYNLLSHSVFSTLIQYMWDEYARRRAIMWFLYNIVYIVIWSLIGVLVSYENKHYYDLPGQWWRLFLHVIGIGLTIWEIIGEVLEYRRSITKNDEWKKFRADELYADMKHCIDSSDRQFLQDELHQVEKQIPRYFKDFWNVFDWVCYGMQGICIISHLADVIRHSEEAARFHINFMALTLILLWLRLAKCARPFKRLGPLIVILAKMIEDFILFGCLYLQFFLPFVCAYWMIFGGERVTYDTRYHDNNTTEYVNVEGFTRFGDVFFSLFRITLVDDYDYQTMKSVDPIMTDILVGSWLTVSAIVCLNLFIALLSDSFQRVYDNAHSIARMQKAIVCLVDWDLLSKSRRKQILNDMRERCNPLQEAYDDDDVEEQTDGNEMQTAVIQLREITRIQKQNQDDLVNRLDHDINKIERDISEIKDIILMLQSSGLPPGHPNYGGAGDFVASELTRSRSTSKKKKKKRKTSSRDDRDDIEAVDKSDLEPWTIPSTGQMKVADISSLNMDDDENL